MINLKLAQSYGLFARHDVLPEDLCQRLRAEMKNASKPGLIYRADGGALIDENTRRVAIAEVSEAQANETQEYFELLLPDLSKHFDLPLKGIQVMEFLTYLDGYHMGPHRDGIEQDEVQENTPENMSTRVVTVVVFLNSAGEDTFTGGDLVIYGLVNPEEPTRHGLPITPQAGLAVGFRSQAFHAVTVVKGQPRFVAVAWYYI